MDIIQITMSFFSRIVKRFKAIGDLLTYNYLPETDEEKKPDGLFWIFNW